MDQIRLVSEQMDQPMPNMQMDVAGHVVHNSMPHHFVVSNQQMEVLGPISSSAGLHNLTLSEKQIGQMEFSHGNMQSQQFFMPTQQFGRMEAMFGGLDSQKLLLPTKRKAEIEPVVSNSVPLYGPNKRMAEMEPMANSHGPPLQPAPSKRTSHMQSASGAQNPQNVSLSNKKMVRNESMSSKPGPQRVQNSKTKTVQMETSPKARIESFEAVRSKMRESLAAALALACQHQDKSPSEEKKSQNEASINSLKSCDDSQAAGFTAAFVESRDHVSEESSVVDKPQGGLITSMETSSDGSMRSSAQKCDGSEQQCSMGLPDEDVSFSDNFFVKDELLQGNGLSWALDFNTRLAETKVIQADDKPKLVLDNVRQDRGEQATVNPQKLAFKIEAELFKFFGGVNKKYKEKGRSLLFNLKDRNNPELIERVVSGEITPERLCSMTAEELASKELSEWRMAKAEELAQMVVLPDSDVNVRRLVKKTHKGEYQVDFDRDDDVSVEVSVGTSIPRIGSKDKKKSSYPRSEADDIRAKDNAAGDTSSLDSKNVPYSLTIPNDGTDLMQGLMVDEFKDADLPPIVSLDEFMESLDSEPPFQDLAVDTRQGMPLGDKEKTEAGYNLVDSGPFSRSDVDTVSDKVDEVDTKSTSLDVKEKSLERTIGEEIIIRKTSQHDTSRTDRVWEGVVQLNVSALVTVVGLFRSGEKTSTTEWPSSLEIKGRVRLDAFENFLQELPMSRSRAVMVIHFVLKDEASEEEHANLREVMSSYIVDERLGFAEPSPGVEIYFCPTDAKVVGMITKHLSQEQTEILNGSDNGLIGVVVWRKAHLSSTISPNTSSQHHKHSLKKQHFTPTTTIRRQQDKDSNVNVNVTTPKVFGTPRSNPQPLPCDDDEDDDVPPGFGPGPSRDEDDLPEFNFLGAVNPPVLRLPSQNPSRITSLHATSHGLSRPVDQVRELIQKYGQTETNVTSRNWQDKRDVDLGLQPWNDHDDDDEDDIPEWQPHAPQPQFQSNITNTIHGFRQPLQGPHLSNQSPSVMTHQSLRPYINSPSSWHQGTRWLTLSRQPNGSGFNSATGRHDSMPVLQAGQPGNKWRRGAPRSRGF